MGELWDCSDALWDFSENISTRRRMAKKTLEEMLGESTATPDTSKMTRRLAVFLEYWGQMEDAYKKGWTWLQIHNALHREGIVDYSYPTFMYYKDRRLKRKLAEAKRNPGTPPSADAKPAPAERPAKQPGSGKVELPTFKDVTRERGDKWF
jgi:hypothetical protein